MGQLNTGYYQTVVEIPKQLGDIKKIKREDSLFIAGGTLLQLNWEAGINRPSHLISMEMVKELHGIQKVSIDRKEFLEIGAATTLADCCEHKSIVEHAPILADACKKIAAPAVRNRGTIGGNIAGKVGDSIPVLFVLEAKLCVYDGEKETIISIQEWLKTTIQQNPVLIITKILIPIKNKEKENYFFQKVGRRESFTAAVISIAGFLKIADKKVTAARFAIGGGAHLPQRLIGAEEILVDTSGDLFAFYKAVETSFSTYSDAFVTEKYRKKVAANILFAKCREIIEKSE
ncbi:xanthine dehydrogenase family protein subunit M [Niallia sp. NCCP-28]|uniref:FAD binding domain-containing protein n=1 Tax=Niallia sp. NCCP-28 TaxID=2934712 RepID=UPI0020815D74|nr:FAD binding domain-containing protein [Niallia sp. NCCP-28]GKU82866.1 putative xanthine dehydrogenase subunit C [Niallia sp. NCCP-28]